MRPLAVLVLAAACGCTPMQWHKADVSAEQFRADDLDCRERAWREASARSWWSPSPSGPVFARHASGGFMVWPTTPLADPYGYQLMEENRLAQSCMESKGYALVPAPKP